MGNTARKEWLHKFLLACGRSNLPYMWWLFPGMNHYSAAHTATCDDNTKPIRALLKTIQMTPD